MAGENRGRWIIALQTLCDFINSKRKSLNKTPIDRGAITTRLILKSNAAHPGRFNFEAPELMLNKEDIPILEDILNDQFGLYLKNELLRQCKSMPEEAPEQPQPATPPPISTKPESPPGGLKSKLKKLFGG